MTLNDVVPETYYVDPASLLEDNRMLIGGRWVPAASGETIDVINPATQEVLARVPSGGKEDVDAAVEAATAAFALWREMNPVARGRLLNKWADLCDEHAHELERLEKKSADFIAAIVLVKSVFPTARLEQ